MAAVRIENDAWGDGRYALLAELCDLADRDFALVLCARVWSYCTDRCEEKLPGAMIDAIAKHKGFADKMVTAELSDKPKSGLYRIRGTKGRIEWLQSRRVAGKKGGEAKAAKDLARASNVPQHKGSTRQAPKRVSYNGSAAAVVPSDSYSGSSSGSENSEHTHTRAGEEADPAQAPPDNESALRADLRSAWDPHGQLPGNAEEPMRAALPKLVAAASERGLALGEMVRIAKDRYVAAKKSKGLMVAAKFFFEALPDNLHLWVDAPAASEKPATRTRVMTHDEAIAESERTGEPAFMRDGT
jgi:hypothetical protein